MSDKKEGVGHCLVSFLILTFAALVLYDAVKRSHPAPAPHPDDEGSVGIPWDKQAMLAGDDERRRCAYLECLEMQLTSSLLKGNLVVEIYPTRPAIIRRGFDGKDRESLILEVQRSQDKAIDGKTRFRTYTWVLDDVKEELR